VITSDTCDYVSQLTAHTGCMYSSTHVISKKIWNATACSWMKLEDLKLYGKMEKFLEESQDLQRHNHGQLQSSPVWVKSTEQCVLASCELESLESNTEAVHMWEGNKRTVVTRVEYGQKNQDHDLQTNNTVSKNVIICNIYIYIYMEYFPAVIVSPPPVSTLPFYNNLLQRGPLLPLLP
jgi:hypothetical protein